jgi:hypothetical protein
VSKINSIEVARLTGIEPETSKNVDHGEESKVFEYLDIWN